MGLIYYALYKNEDQLMMYIGQVKTETGTCRTFEDRKKEHLNKVAERDTNFHNMLFRKGIDNWEWGLIPPEVPDSLLNKREKDLINRYKNEKKIILTNEVHNRKSEKKNISHNNFSKRSSSQKSLENIDTLGWHFKWGKIKPVKNISTNKIYRSINKAASESQISPGSIRYSCTTGRPAVNNQKYIFIDLSEKEILPESYKQNLTTRRNKKSYSKIKHLNTGKTYTNIESASIELGLKSKSIQEVCSGRYYSTKQKRGSKVISHSFCYVNIKGEDLLKEKHKQFITDLEEKELYKIAVYEIDDSDYKIPFLYDDIEAIINDPKLELPPSSRNHIHSVIKGERTRVGGYRFAKYDTKKKKPELHEKHKEDAKRIIKKLICLNDKKIFKNASKAAIKYKLSSGQIRLCCKGVLKTTGNDECNIRYRFAYLDSNNKPILTETHLLFDKAPTQIGRRVFCAELGGEIPSKAEFLRKLKNERNIIIPYKTLDKHLNNPEKYPLDGIFVHYLD